MNKEIAWTLILTAGLSLASWTSALANDPPVVTNVTASQQQGSTLVDIYYDVDDPDSDVLWVSAVASADGGVTYTIPVQSTWQGSDIGSGIASGQGKHIIWDAGIDMPGHAGDDYTVRVEACENPPANLALFPGPYHIGDQDIPGCDPVSPNGTTWTDSFELADVPAYATLTVEGAQFYYDTPVRVNGIVVGTLEGLGSAEDCTIYASSVNAEVTSALHVGTNTISITCHHYMLRDYDDIWLRNIRVSSP